MKLTHPETNQTIEVSKDYEEMYRSQGWVDPKSSKSEGK